MLLALKEEFPVVVLCLDTDTSIRICISVVVYEDKSNIYLLNNYMRMYLKCVEYIYEYESV